MNEYYKLNNYASYNGEYKKYFSKKEMIILIELLINSKRFVNIKI